MKLYQSVATIATRSGATVVPVTISGLLSIRVSVCVQADFSRRRLARVTIRIHAATRLPEFVTSVSRVKRQTAADVLTGVMQRAAVESRTRHTLYEAFPARR